MLNFLAAAIVMLSFAHFSFAQTALNGVSLHKELGKEQFIAGLYSETLSSSRNDILIANTEKEMQIRILADSLSSRAFKKMWIEGLAINASSKELTLQSQNMADFSNLLRIKLLRGDIFSIKRSSKEVTLTINGAKLGKIDDPKFFDLLLRAWIGPVPLSTDFRSGLLAEGNLDPALAARYQTTQPNAARIAAITAGLNALAAATASKAAALAKAESTPEVKTTKTPKSKPTKKPAPKVATPKPTKKPTPTPKPKLIALNTPPEAPELLLGSPSSQLLDSSIFDLSDDDVQYTAESLLSQQLYIAKLKKWSQRFIKYPALAFKRNQQGNVRLNVSIDRDGKVSGVEVLESARYSSLTKEAKSAINRASPFPRIPADLPGDQFTFSIPIVFMIVDE